jgi:glycerophosphoryl diester phosphodiesterase
VEAVEELRLTTRTMNLGHRGAMSLAPENTLAAFAMAREVGADGVEFDAQLSADGELVIIHDHTLERTTDGHGAVSNHSLAELKQLHAGRWFDARYSGERIPTLQEVIDLLGNEMFLNIELKGGHGESVELPDRVVECVRRNRCEGRVLLSSFHMETLRRVREIAQDLAIGMLYSQPLGSGPHARCTSAPAAGSREPLGKDQIAGLRAEALHPEWKLAGAELVRSAHAAGQKVNVWTVNAEADMRNLIALGVDAIITNYPQLLAAILQEPRP